MRGASRPTNILCRFTRSMFVRVQLSPPPRVWCGHPRERMAVARGDRVLEVPPRERLREVRGLAEDRGAGRTTCAQCGRVRRSGAVLGDLALVPCDGGRVERRVARRARLDGPPEPRRDGSAARGLACTR